MVRRGFTLVEVIVALTLLVVAALGLAAAAALAQRALRTAELHERSVRLAGAMLDSLGERAARTAARDSSLRDGITLRWSAGGADAVDSVSASYRAGREAVSLEFAAPAVPRLPVRRP